MADERSETGLWVDTLDPTRPVVEVQPVEAIQLVPKGGIVSPDVATNIRIARELHDVLAAQAKVGSETDPEPPKRPHKPVAK